QLAVDLGYADTPDSKLRVVSGTPSNEGLLKRRQRKPQGSGVAVSVDKSVPVSRVVSTSHPQQDIAIAGSEDRQVTEGEADIQQQQQPQQQQEVAEAERMTYTSLAGSRLAWATQTPIDSWRFIRTRTKGVKRRVLWRLFLAQELNTMAHDGTDLESVAQTVDESIDTANSSIGSKRLVINNGAAGRGGDASIGKGSISSSIDISRDLRIDPSTGRLGPSGRVFSSL
ncbi:hypothetical protein EV182_008266, partial [Spiromyces aspiralis]